MSVRIRPSAPAQPHSRLAHEIWTTHCTSRPIYRILPFCRHFAAIRSHELRCSFLQIVFEALGHCILDSGKNVTVGVECY